MNHSRKLFGMACIIAALLAVWWVSRTRKASSNVLPNTSLPNPTSPTSVQTPPAPLPPRWRENVTNNLTKTGPPDLEKLRSLATSIPIHEIADVLKYLREAFPLSERRDLETFLIERWASSAPLAAMDWIERNTADADRKHFLSRAGAAWASNDPNAAWEWAQQLTDEDDRGAAMTGSAYQVAQDKPALAFTFAEELPESSGIDLVSHAAAVLAQKSPQEALAAATSLMNANLQLQATASVAVAWADTDPVSAGKLAVESLPPGKLQNDTVVGIIQRWTQQDPGAAAAWVLAFPLGELGNTATENLVKLWTDKDAAAAGNWLSGLAEGTRRDFAVAAYADKLATRAPDLAAQWLDHISDAELRRQHIENLAEIWAASDPAAAHAWMSKLASPDEPKAVPSGSSN